MLYPVISVVIDYFFSEFDWSDVYRSLFVGTCVALTFMFVPFEEGDKIMHIKPDRYDSLRAFLASNGFQMGEEKGEKEYYFKRRWIFWYEIFVLDKRSIFSNVHYCRLWHKKLKKWAEKSRAQFLYYSTFNFLCL